eukprot:GILK01012388.1.p1 GENE.GILK01012388.1~~GILK01012388.1.p1  ORF type:complete len:133 (-),score=13.55 GILK01012388.1:43-441(-)
MSSSSHVDKNATAHFVSFSSDYTGLPETATKKVLKTAYSLSTYISTMANEPSVGLFYVAEHVRHTAGHIVAAEAELERCTEQLQHGSHDLDYSIDIVGGMESIAREWSSKVLDLSSSAVQLAETISKHKHKR